MPRDDFTVRGLVRCKCGESMVQPGQTCRYCRPRTPKPQNKPDPATSPRHELTLPARLAQQEMAEARRR